MLNSQAFRKKHFASHVVGVLTYLVWNVPSPGDYLISVWRGQQLTRRLILVARENAANPQVDIDLAAPTKANHSEDVLSVAVNGKAVFYCSQGSGEYQITVAQKSKAGEKEIFDSARLKDPDHFIMVPIIAGTYRFSLESKKPSGTILVTSASGKKLSPHKLKPQHVTVDKTGLQPSKIEAKPGQPIVFTIRTSDKFAITLLPQSTTRRKS